jgi:hypothetical protein
MKKGYKKAQCDLNDQANFAVTRTLAYIREDALKLQKKVYCSDKYMIDKQVISILPRWTITLLGTEYILRCPLRRQWNTMWIMTKENSHILDTEITTIFKNTKYEISTEDKQKEMDKQMERLYSSLPSFCYEKMM